ncbi:Bacterial alpha-L-rhamnosidase [Paenibacillus sp. LMG 31461]|uniref:Bacterial alpha-L-rhamnosidase n=1 Tax=Paenibacillus plantarum TaxID=2654975 RepID=A0ABX1XAR9_9BACL|nr:alpha-L-rhamnosidase C-terminal domain-containing protein [Paenibacillus plantarum]NOU65486.1 Bacterial alpha-L-rhamnosidase [Paenibacillus plantarum]
MRILLTDLPYNGQIETNQSQKPWEQTTGWPCRWVTYSEAAKPPYVIVYRCTFTLSEAIRLRVHVSGDERYELFLDHVRIGRGSERGDRTNWFYETYEVELAAGEHQWIARCWALGEHKPWAQVSVQPGILLSPDDEALAPLMGTGVAHWEAKPMPGYHFVPLPSSIGTGAKLDIDGASFDWDALQGGGDGWLPVQPLANVYHSKDNYHFSSVQRLMRPATLPAMQENSVTTMGVRFVEQAGILESDGFPVIASRDLIEEHERWNGLLTGQPIHIPANTHRRVIIDLGDYYCFYPELVVSGGNGSVIRLHWEESFYDEADGGRKTNRNAIAGKWFRGYGDTFRPDGGTGRSFDTLWWHAGRYGELIVETGIEVLDLKAFRLLETRYPLEMEGSIESSDKRLNHVVKSSFRTLQMCAHETYMDCPYWEQLMYVGDTRIQSLITYVSTLDDRLPRKALDMFRVSRNNHLGLVNCAYPDQSGKHIASFSLWWVAMVYDYALWRGDREWIRFMMSSVRDELDRLLQNRASNGAVKLPISWNFMDWQTAPSDAWNSGTPPHGADRLNAAYNLQMIHTLELVAKLEAYLGETELESRARRLAKELGSVVEQLFWNDERGLFADETSHQYYSEHAQVLSLLCEPISPELNRRLVPGILKTANDLMRTSVYFDHYTFDVLASAIQIEALLDRLEPWFGMEANGLKTTPEIFLDSTRSDCHAWGAHPVYHLYTNLLGIRPASMGFASVVIRPQLGSLTRLHGKLPHPNGFIEVNVACRGSQWHVEVTVPQGLPGSLVWGQESYPLHEGQNEFEFSR